MTAHYKKLTQPFFEHVKLGVKTFELRKNDCNYRSGDIIVLQEYDEVEEDYTGEEITVFIKYVLKDYKGLEEGYVIMGIEVLEKCS